MQHLLEAKATITPAADRGEFEALAATWDRDREGDVIVPGAFAKSIAEWRSVGRLVPVHWNHGADEIVGHVDPQSMHETSDGLEVAGKVDLDTERGRNVWKLLKANRLAFSFGYMPTKARQRGGTRELLEVDVFEISITASPANNRTRVLAKKSIDQRRYVDIHGNVFGPEGLPAAMKEMHDRMEAKAKAARPVIKVATFSIDD